MNKYIIGLIGMILFSTLAYAATYTIDIINWGFGGINRAKEWVSPDGRLNMQNLTQESTSLDFWGATNLPTNHSISEITLHRNTYGLPYDERINISAMAQANNGAYRIGVERSGTGSFKDFIVCFEDVTPGVSACNFKITQTGVFVSDDGGTNWRSL